MTHVLVVDDSADNRYLLQVLLNGNGFTMDAASNGSEALAVAARRVPDIVVSDLLMPVMDGYALLQHWRRDERLAGVPFVVYTATYTAAEDEALAMRLGADAFLIKPCEPERLLDALRNTQRKVATSGLGRSLFPGDGATLSTQYNQVLIRKLEQKSIELEEANRQLLQQIAERIRITETQSGVLNALDAAVALLDERGSIIATNHPWDHCDGVSPLCRPEMRIGTSYVAALDAAATLGDAQADRGAEDVRRVLAGEGRRSAFEFSAPGADGLRWFRLTVSALGGDTHGAVVTHVDVTDTRLADLRSRAADERLALAVKAASIGVWQWDAARSSGTWDERMYEIYGLAPGAPITPEGWLAMVHPDDRARIAFAVSTSPPASTRRREFRIVRPDGEVRHLLVAERMMETETGQRSIVGMTWDLTDLRAAEEHRGELQQRFETLVHKATIGVLVHINFKPVMANDHLAHMFGLADRSAIMALDDISAMFPESEQERIHRFYERRLAGMPVPGLYELEGQRADGTLITVENRTFPMSWGTETAVCALLTDVTEQRAMETQLRQSQKLEAIGKLTGGVAHDFNNLLTVILGNADLLGHELRNDPRLGPVAALIQQAAERGAALTNQLLTIARKQALDLKPTNLNRVVSGMRHLLMRTLGEQVEVGLDLGADLPSIVVDQALLENAILNLCLNARDAMPDGGTLTVSTRSVRVDGDMAVTLEGADPGDYVVVEIADTGVGMEPALVSRAVEPFFTTKEAGKGTGLGLSTVYGFARQSSGRLALASWPGHGTVATLYFPAAADEDTPQAEVHEETAPGTGRILAVEDDAMVREHVVGTLTQLGYEVTGAASGREALEILATGAHFDLLFTDVVMPGGLNGVELAREVAALRQSMAVLLTSGYADTALASLQGAEPHFNIIWKPYRRSELAEKIREAIEMPFEKGI